MIRKVGIIYQDRNSFGFLCGLRDRLRCEAELVSPDPSVGKSRQLTRKQVRLAWRSFQKQGVDLVVRFTDADRHRWQEVRRQELDIFPDPAKPIWLCGVAVNNVEEWLALDPDYLARKLGVNREDLEDPHKRTGCIKNALARLSRADDGLSDVVTRLVSEAPPEVFRRWLDEESLRAFYTDCRAAATEAQCETPNEMESPK